MGEKINVLVFPAGEVNSLEIHDALATCVNINLYGASSIERHGKFIFKKYIGGLPLITDDDFFERFNEVVDKYKIDIIFPTHDTVVKYLSENTDKFDAKLIGGDERTSKICRSKISTYNHFKNSGFTPKIFENIDEIKTYPVFAKPDEGQGGAGAVQIDSKSEIKNIDIKNFVITEFLPGKELTVDCITNKNRKLLFISPRTRDRIMAGVSVAGETVPLTNEIKNIASKINNSLKFLGLWFFQVKQDKTGNYKLLEISTRCASSMGLTRAIGINLPLLSVYIAMGYEIDVFANPYSAIMDRTLISRYLIDYKYDKVFFDLDDTIIIDNKVNLNVIRFLYQCKNEDKKLYLITKHEKELGTTLSKHFIPEKLFDKIFHLKENENKSDYINPKAAIFIDNAFKERKIVYEKFGIPVFDVDGIEVLLDWRL